MEEKDAGGKKPGKQQDAGPPNVPERGATEGTTARFPSA